MLAQKVVLYSPVSDERLLEETRSNASETRFQYWSLSARLLENSKMSSTKS